MDEELWELIGIGTRIISEILQCPSGPVKLKSLKPGITANTEAELSPGSEVSTRPAAYGEGWPERWRGESGAAWGAGVFPCVPGSQPSGDSSAAVTALLPARSSAHGCPS